MTSSKLGEGEVCGEEQTTRGEFKRRCSCFSLKPEKETLLWKEGLIRRPGVKCQKDSSWMV